MVEYDFSYQIWDFGAISSVPNHFHLHLHFEKLTAATH